MRICICGSRTYDDAEFLDATMDKLTRKLDKKKLVILSGGNRGTKDKHGKVLTRGADRLGEEWANKRMVPMQIYHAEWTKYGKSAGLRRNREMARQADVCIAFWDGKSDGTRNMIEEAEKHGVKVKVIRYKEDGTCRK